MKYGFCSDISVEIGDQFCFVSVTLLELSAVKPFFFLLFIKESNQTKYSEIVEVCNNANDLTNNTDLITSSVFITWRSRRPCNWITLLLKIGLPIRVLLFLDTLVQLCGKKCLFLNERHFLSRYLSKFIGKLINHPVLSTIYSS